MIHAFLGFELDERLFELRHQGRVVAIQTRVFGMIAYLLRNRDRVVPKDELIRELWQVNVASDMAISQVVMLARKALNDEGESQRIIKTVRGRGFRFIADVRTVEPKHVPSAGPATNASDGAAPKPKSYEGLVGRDAELDALLGALSELEQGRGGLILLEGEPGIGKTTLASAFARQASARSIDARWGRAWEAGGAPPYWPFVQVLRGMAEREGLPAIRKYMEHGASALSGMMPEWAGPEAAAAPLDAGSAHARFRLFDAMSRFLRNACGAADGGKPARQPRLIILDDLHAVDEASIELLRFLCSELADIPLLIVATLRDLPLASNPMLAQLAESLPEPQRVRLRGFSSDDSSKLIAQRLGQPASAQVLSTLHELSGGNPLLLGEMCRQLGSAGVEAFIEPATLQSLTLPERMASAVRKQISELPEATAEALSVASVLGRDFSTPLLAALSGITEAALLERLAPARGLIRQAAASDQRSFSHALIYNAVYVNLPEQRRLELHRNVAQALEQQAHLAGTSGRVPLFEIAHHYYQAAALDCRQQALDYALRAAKQASDVTAFEVAAGLYDRAIGLAEVLGSDSLDLHVLLASAGEAWYHAGRLAQAIARFDRAAAAARSEHAAERFAMSVLRSAYTLRSGWFYNRARQHDLLEALALIPETDSEIRAYLLGATALGMRGDQCLAARDSATMAAVEMAQRLGSDTVLVRTVLVRHITLWGVAHPRAVLEIADEIVRLSSNSSLREHLLDGLLFRLSHLSELGDLRGVLGAFEYFARELDRRPSPWHAYMLGSFAPAEAAARGDFAGAEQLSARTLREGLRVQDPMAAANHAVRCMLLQFERGVRHLPLSAAGGEEPPDFVPQDYHAFWALWWVNQGQHTRAAQAMTRLCSHDWSNVVTDTLRRPLLAVAAQVCARLDERAQLEWVYARLLPELGLRVIVQAGIALGPVATHLATVAAALGRDTEADTYFRRALDECLQGSPWSVRTQFAYGKWLLTRDPTRARGLLQTANKTAEQYGMRDLQQDIEAALHA